MVPARDKAANTETVPGKLGHLVSQAKRAFSDIQTSVLSLLLRALLASEISLHGTILTNEDVYCTLTICNTLLVKSSTFFPQKNFKGRSIILNLFLFPCDPFRRGGTDHVPGQKQAGQEACQCNSECGSPSSAGLVLLHRP